MKTTLSLTAESAERLRNLADQRQTTLGEVIRRALQLEEFLTKVRDEGGRVFVEKDDGDDAKPPSKTEVVIF